MEKIREILRSNVWKWKSYKIAFIFGAALFFISFAVLVNPAQQNITLNELGNLDRFNKRTVQDASGMVMLFIRGEDITIDNDSLLSLPYAYQEIYPDYDLFAYRVRESRIVRTDPFADGTDWVTVEKDSGIVPSFMVGDTEIVTDGAELRWLFSNQDYLPPGRIGVYNTFAAGWVSLSDLEEVIIVGEKDGSRISGGHPFIITNHSRAALIANTNAARYVTATHSFLLFCFSMLFILFPAFPSPRVHEIDVVDIGIMLSVAVIPAMLVLIIMALYKYWIIILLMCIGIFFWIFLKSFSMVSKQDIP